MILESPTLPILETPRLFLRPMNADDASLVVSWRNSLPVASMSRQSTSDSFSIESHLEWFARTRSSRIDYIIEIRDERRPIGGLSFAWHTSTHGERCVELGKYIGDQETLGKGYATEAARRWLEYAFDTLNLECIFALTRRINTPNIRINIKLGFSIEPFLENFAWASDEWVFMRLNRADWMAKNTKFDVLSKKKQR